LKTNKNTSFLVRLHKLHEYDSSTVEQITIHSAAFYFVAVTLHTVTQHISLTYPISLIFL